MNIVLIPLLKTLIVLADIYLWIVFLSVVLSWLISFEVINLSNMFVYKVYVILKSMTEPLFRRLRRVLPVINGIDLSPIALVLVIYFIKEILIQILIRL